MNIVLNAKGGKVSGRKLYLFLLPFLVLVASVIFLMSIDRSHHYAPASGVLVCEFPFSVIEEVAASYGVPPGAMERFAAYLADNDFNRRYGGVGLFSVRPSHVGWLSESVLADTRVDLDDPVQNAHVAAFLLRRFYDSGYSWPSCFLIYAYGFSSVNAGDGYKDFINFIFEGE